ncbi:MAG TPA: hypothetical protein VJ732_02045 [Bryobacteraceae bacterium]|nr:hypothetical protein [Bryobacteraceae bacterium]
MGREFRIREGASLEVRAEFTNIFNRTEPNNPVTSNALATQTRNAAGQTSAGFGAILPTTTGVTFLPPRQGQLVAGFRF